jgi:3-oxoacyl-[acyl-carrier protein] reductase
MTRTGNKVGPLTGKVAVITGGGHGIGAAIAERLVQMSATVVICGRSMDSLRATAERLRGGGGDCEAMQCDVSVLTEVERLQATVEQNHKRLDVLVNNAGVGSFATPLHRLDPGDWDRVINTNLRGVYYMIRAFAPLMMRSGAGDIVNISSIAGKNALPNGAAYAASKWGLNGLSYSVAEELRAHNIRVSVICPGSTNTDLSPHEGKSTSKMLQPSDVAHAVAMILTQAPQSFASEIVLRPTQKP